MPETGQLAKTLEKLRKRIALKKGQRLNEENTKATLVEPLLSALGWDVEDVDEVQREFRLKSRDKPVDYGLLLLRNARLFVEAKALGEDLDDRRWTNQIMGYAGVAGVQWIVLTDGDEYRIYNSHAPVSVEEKLFRKVRVSDEGAVTAETLELLAKNRMKEKRIDELWQAQFVDRQVKAALDQLFSGEGDLLLVNYVTQHADKLSEPEIRSSLRRCRPTFDFPLPTEELLRRSTPAGAKTKGEPTGERAEVSLKDLIEAGLLRPPVALEKEYKGATLKARIEAEDRVTFQGTVYDSLSAAGGAARASVLGTKEHPHTNGWTFWKMRGPDGELVEVDAVRKRYVEGGRGGSASRVAT